MSELSVQKPGQKKDWALTPQAFQRLLGWLDGEADSDGQNYLEMRRRLVAYFDRKNCATPDELTDETLNRVARRLDEEEGFIEGETPAKYCYIVARFVFMEHLRGARKDNALLDGLRRESQGNNHSAPVADGDEGVRETILDCLEQCVGILEPPQREMIIRYYVGRERAKIENRRALAAELGITINALSIRACRTRDKLEACVTRCVGAK